jgi:NADPH-dependent 2,4-dienoyl-CoA reductase/sulfur reductase-like enzyme
LKIVILGNGIAGFEAAFAAKQAAPHGTVSVVTREPHPLYSACVLADYVCREVERRKVFLCSPPDYASAGIDLSLSRDITDWSPEDRLLRFEGGELPYDRLILATGSRPIVPAIPGVEKEGVVSLKTFDDAERLRVFSGRSVVVVGTGPVGIETAVAFRRLGWSVTLVELQDRVLPRMFDAPIAGSLRKRLEANGVSVFLEEGVVEILGDKQVEGVATDRRTIPADLVVLVVGMRPDTVLAKKGGLVIGPSGGIQVDDSMQTSSAEVWACGDCVESRELLSGKRGLYMLWNNARSQGRIAGANAAGEQRQYPGSLNLTTVNVFGETAASVGALAADFPGEEIRTVYRKGLQGEIGLVVREKCVVGIQALGGTDRVGGLLGAILRGDDLLKDLLVGRTSFSWPLHGFQRDLIRLLDIG